MIRFVGCKFEFGVISVVHVHIKSAVLCVPFTHTPAEEERRVLRFLRHHVEKAHVKAHHINSVILQCLFGGWTFGAWKESQVRPCRIPDRTNKRSL